MKKIIILVLIFISIFLINSLHAVEKTKPIPYLGVLYDTKNNYCAEVYSVGPDTNVSKAGLKNGDMICKVNMTDLNSKNTLEKVVSELTPGKRATLYITKQNGIKKTIDFIVEDKQAEQPTNKSYTFLNIGENDTIKTIHSKLFDNFQLFTEAQIPAVYPFELSDLLKSKDATQEFRKSANNYYEYANKFNNVRETINAQDKSMILYIYTPRSDDPVIKSANFYFSKSNKKLLSYYVIFKRGSFDILSKKFTEKFGDKKTMLSSSGGRSNNPLDTSVRPGGIGLYYWEQGNDCAYLISKSILFDINVGDELIIIYGSSIDEHIASMKQIHEQSIKENVKNKSEEADRRSKEMNKF